jgi:AcrR family transcriptional regulator
MIHKGEPMRAPKLRTQVRRDQIAAAALGVITAGGMRALSIAAVAREVGLAPSAIYRHYHGREAIIDAALELIRDKLLGNVNAVRAETADPVERLRRLLARDVRLIRENRALPRVLFSEEVFGGRPERRARAFAIIRAYLDQIAEICRQGQLEGRVRRDLDSETFAMLFIGIVRPAAILGHLSRGRVDAARHAGKAWTLLRELLAPRAGRRPAARAAGKRRS